MGAVKKEKKQRLGVRICERKSEKARASFINQLIKTALSLSLSRSLSRGLNDCFMIEDAFHLNNRAASAAAAEAIYIYI